MCPGAWPPWRAPHPPQQQRELGYCLRLRRFRLLGPSGAPAGIHRYILASDSETQIRGQEGRGVGDILGRQRAWIELHVVTNVRFRVGSDDARGARSANVTGRDGVGPDTDLAAL